MLRLKGLVLKQTARCRVGLWVKQEQVVLSTLTKSLLTTFMGCSVAVWGVKRDQ